MANKLWKVSKKTFGSPSKNSNEKEKKKKRQEVDGDLSVYMLEIKWF